MTEIRSESRDSRVRVAELLADGGVTDRLRRAADAGEVPAAERLAERLAELGCVGEIRERADRGEAAAADALADLYAAWGEVDLLRERARFGDKAAELRLSKLRKDGPHGGAGQDEIDELRAAVDEGRPEAALQLCTLLFELRDEKNLRAEVNAGTTGAGDRLVALYHARDDPDLIRLRAYGLDADGHVSA